MYVDVSVERTPGHYDEPVSVDVPDGGSGLNRVGDRIRDESVLGGTIPQDGARPREGSNASRGTACGVVLDNGAVTDDDVGNSVAVEVADRRAAQDVSGKRHREAGGNGPVVKDDVE